MGVDEFDVTLGFFAQHKLDDHRIGRCCCQPHQEFVAETSRCCALDHGTAAILDEVTSPRIEAAGLDLGHEDAWGIVVAHQHLDIGHVNAIEGFDI